MGSFNDHQYYAGSQPPTFTWMETNTNIPSTRYVKTCSVGDVDGFYHQFYFDEAQRYWISTETSRIKLSEDMMTAIQAGRAELDWREERIKYKDAVRDGWHRPPVEYGLIGDEDKSPNMIWLDAEVNKVCREGRALLAAA